MAHHLDVRSIVIRGIAVFRCVDCGAVGHGDTVTIELPDFSGDALRAAVANIHPTHMPVGWASYGRGIVRCPAHAI